MIGVALALALASPAPKVEVAPMVQLGHGAPVLVWQTNEVAADWRVHYAGRDAKVSFRTYAPVGQPLRRIYRAALTGLKPSQKTPYALSAGSKTLFRSTFSAPKGAKQPFRFVALGDTGDGSAAQRSIAEYLPRLKPDLALLLGDIVYNRGLGREYDSRFFPFYGKLADSTLSVGVTGNHDVLARDLAEYPDGMAYYTVWDQPLNGPQVRAGQNAPRLSGSPEAIRAFERAAGPAWPRGGTFSFDYGDVHFTVLDSNAYMDWNDPALRAWLARDLRAGMRRAWRIVLYHVTPFTAGETHTKTDYMKTIQPILEQYRVSLVLMGHVHNYQRTRPARKIGDRWVWDLDFDGVRRTRPQGPIYVVSGAGGGPLYDKALASKRPQWNSWMAAAVSKHSVSVVDVDASSLRFRQLSPDGRVLDQFRIDRSTPPAIRRKR